MKTLNNDNINANMFMALKVSEKTGIPFLFISSPGVGKTATLQMYADLRGCDLVMLILSRCNVEDVNGCDVFSGDKKDRSLVKMRPYWFQKVMENHKKGIRSILFLDEITTAPQHIQGAALNLIFDREVAGEHLPEDTLIVSAGNYCQSLGNQFTLLPPLMNRFCIFNIEPTVNDIETFLSHYSGASVGEVDENTDFFAPTKEILKEIDSQEIVYDKKYLLSVAEYAEKAVLETTKLLINSKKLLNLKVKDMQNIFNDTDQSDQNLYGFISPRSLYYLVKVTIGTYECFGIEGIKSDNFLNIVNGLVGIALSFDAKKETKLNYVGNDYFQYIGKAINDVESKNNTKVSEYLNYFSTVLTEKAKNGKKVLKKSLSKEEINSIGNKFTEMVSDPLIKNLERPIEFEALKSISKLLRISSQEIAMKFNSPGSGTIDAKSIEIGTLSKTIVEWNLVKSVERHILNFLKDSKRGYEERHIKEISADYDEINRHAFKIQYIIKYVSKNNAAEAGLLPVLDTM